MNHMEDNRKEDMDVYTMDVDKAKDISYACKDCFEDILIMEALINSNDCMVVEISPLPLEHPLQTIFEMGI